MMRIFGVILAGGGGRRFGGADKALLVLAGQTLVARAVDRLLPQVEALAISANGDPARLGFLGLPVLADTDGSRGPLSGILAALDWAAAKGAQAVVSVAVDVPFLPGDLVPQLCLAADGARRGAAVAVAGGQAHPTCALWPVAVRDDLRAFLALGQSARVMGFAAAIGATEARFDPAAFVNLNTAEDLAGAEAMLADKG